ncbi:MAG: HypC/HybG/HupF family hydrogenase formation chaperone [Deltaproteobacteria bacterium]|nr:HypC/HybG/HupF family hydrogenase formation chaperone [Deltaproteobacteria bacterium]
MCLGVPGRIVRIADQNGIRMGDVDFGGITRRACLAYVPEAGVGDYVVIHAGFGISKVDAREARRTLKLIEELEPNKERS